MGNTLQGSRVFIALRTAIFKDFERGEHITVEFIGSFPDWNLVSERLKYWEGVFKTFPVKVEVNGYANYTAGDGRYFQVAMMKFPEHNTNLNYSKFWHLTMGKQDEPFKEARAFDPEVDAFNYDICDDLWVGYKDKNNVLRWLPYHQRPSPTWTSNVHEAPF